MNILFIFLSVISAIKGKLLLTKVLAIPQRLVMTLALLRKSTIGTLEGMVF